MVKVLAVNNYPTHERFKRLEGCLRGNGADVFPVEWNQISQGSFDSCDGAVLSGSPDMISDPKIQAKYEKEVGEIVDAKVPVLGVCFGHQMIAHAFGSKVVKGRKHVLDMVKTIVLADDPLFQGLPRSMMLLESRHEVVESIPKGFRLLARSETSKIAAMRHTSRPLYGVQFHPERFTNENSDGNAVVGNFIRLLR